MNRLNKGIKNENFKKDLMNSTEVNHKISMNSEHSVSSNKWFKVSEYPQKLKILKGTFSWFTVFLSD